MARPRVAIAHDYLTQRGGAERVVLALARAFPDAAIHTTLYEPASTYPEFEALDVRTSFINRVPAFRRDHRRALPVLPLAARSISIDADVVVASSSGWAHGFRTTGRSVVYCHTPAHWLYDTDRYLGAGLPAVAPVALRVLAPALRRWDRTAARRPDVYLANSTLIKARIHDAYQRESRVVPAPHGVQTPTEPVPHGHPLPDPGYFLVVSRLMPYKNVAAVVDAFAEMPERRLLVVGAGPQKPDLVAAAGANVTFLEGLSDAQMSAVYAGCAGLVAASHEDFGLVPLEAAAHGKPVAALRWGGFLDTVLDGITGVFFDEPTPASIRDGVQRMAEGEWDTDLLHKRADEFSEEVFAKAIHAEVDALAP